MKRRLILAAFLLWTATPAMAAQGTCENFANTMTKHVVDIFHDTTKNEAQKREELTKTFKEAVDTDWIGKFVLGRYWKLAKANEQAEYLKTYREYLTHVYISKFNEEDGMDVTAIKLVSFVPASNGNFEAKTLIQQKDEPDVHADYLLTEVSGKCQVHDIKVEGVSLLASGRSEFGALAHASGVHGVVDAMKKKLAN